GDGDGREVVGVSVEWDSALALEGADYRQIDATQAHPPADRILARKQRVRGSGAHHHDARAVERLALVVDAARRDRQVVVGEELRGPPGHLHTLVDAAARAELLGVLPDLGADLLRLGQR